MTIKSCPLDPVPASVLKQCTSVLLPVLTQIVNQSLNLAAFPDCFKLALLNPLLKKPTLDVEVLSNFRPISNLMFMSKLTEKTVASQLINHISSKYYNLHINNFIVLKQLQSKFLMILSLTLIGIGLLSYFY